MEAFFHGDIERTATLTHEKTLRGFADIYLRELDKAQAEGREQRFLAEAGVKTDAQALRKMSIHDLYVTVVVSNQKRVSPEGLAAMQRTVVSVERSELLNPNEVAVQLKIIIPADQGNVTQTGKLLVGKQGDLWRVISNL
jgi:hypothetical protein